MIRNNVRGGYRLLNIAHKLGLLNCVVRYRLTDAVTIDVPIFIDQWSEADIWDYERQLIDMLVAFASDLEGPTELVDCGAEIGLISVLLAARCPGLVRVRAFEPNERVFPFLASNMRRLPVEAEAHRAGLGDFNGTGILRRPEHDGSDHAHFVERKSEGDFPVLKVDDVGIGSDCNLILKIDVEGGELAVLKGAASTLARVRDFIISVEAHPLQVKRTGIDPMECLQFVQSLRPCSAVVSERPQVSLRADRPFFDQMPDTAIYNMIITSRPTGK
jgi:FkbM family methyltransferase